MSGDLFGDATPPAPPAAPACPSCAQWEQDRTSGAYAVGCADCKARGIARSPAAWRAVKGITDVDVRASIVDSFGEDNYREGRRLVWTWINKLKGKGA